MNISKLNEQLKQILKEVHTVNQQLIDLVPYLEECEIIFSASATEEINGQVDYVHGGLTNGYEVTEENTGSVLVSRHDNSWHVEIFWKTDHFSIEAEEQIFTLQQLYDFILHSTSSLDNVEILEVIK